MSRMKKFLPILSIVSLIVFSGFIAWSVTRASVPEDVKDKLGDDLIAHIQQGTWDSIHDCIIMCISTDDAYTVVSTLPSESVETIWDNLGGFHAFLTPEQIFSIARMNEVVRIDYNAVVTVI
ncbi:MAG: hypothetical protein ACFFCP_05100 [Promethearchaeota archaeon]